MEKRIAPWAAGALSTAGAVLIIAFFLPWVSVFGQSATGLGIAWDDNHWLFLVPLSGIALLGAARTEYARLAAIVAGLLVCGDVLLKSTHAMLDADLATWLVLGGAAAMIAGTSQRHASLRALGGLVVLAGFFAPWDSGSMFRSLLDSDARSVASAFGVMMYALWLVPVGALLGLAASRSPEGRKLAGLAGGLVLGGILIYLGSALTAVFSWGAYATLGASAVALVIGVLAPPALRGLSTGSNAEA